MKAATKAAPNGRIPLSSDYVIEARLLADCLAAEGVSPVDTDTDMVVTEETETEGNQAHGSGISNG